jgi:hypothetical protein
VLFRDVGIAVAKITDKEELIMGFKIASATHGTPDPVWMPIAYNSGQTIYVGQIVKMATTGGIQAVGAAASTPTTTAGIGLGLVVGLNDRTATYDSTYKTQSITAVLTQAAQKARTYAFQEGMYCKNDPLPLAHVVPILPSTYLEGQIYVSAFGTAPTIKAATAANGTAGLGYTTAAIDFTPVAANATSYCVTGANAGLYRVHSDTSTTVHTFGYGYFPFTVAVGDTYKSVNVVQGYSKIDFDATNQYIECSAALSNYFSVYVKQLKLSEAGKETAIFRFVA